MGINNFYTELGIHRESKITKEVLKYRKRSWLKIREIFAELS